MPKIINPYWKEYYAAQRIGRKRKKYWVWRKKVFARDKYKCVECKGTDNLQAHHIHPWNAYLYLRFRVDNGITLCRDCHIRKHPWIDRKRYAELLKTPVNNPQKRKIIRRSG